MALPELIAGMREAAGQMLKPRKPCPVCLDIQEMFGTPESDCGSCAGKYQKKVYAFRCASDPENLLRVLDSHDLYEAFYLEMRKLHGHTDLDSALDCRICEVMEQVKERSDGEALNHEKEGKI